MNQKFIFFCISFLFLFSILPVHGRDLIENDTVVVYKVTHSNNATNAWYNENYSTFYNYHVSNDSMVNITIKDINYPTLIDLTIGNLSRVGITDNEAENALAFGYWLLPNRFGFVSNTSWTDVKEDFSNIKFNASSFKENLKDDYLGNFINVVYISFEDNFQKTVLIYDKENGMLLFARSEVFNFFLELEIFSVNGDESYFTNINQVLLNFIAFIPYLLVFFVSIRYFIIQKQKTMNEY